MTIWVTGAPDPEMEKVKNILCDAGETVVQATTEGTPVHPGNAYRATGAANRNGPVDIHGENVILVECGFIPFCDENGCSHEGHPQPPFVEVEAVIDHHRPGDPGYGRKPEDFLVSSSLGQVITELAEMGKLPSSWPTREGFSRDDSGDIDYLGYKIGWAVCIRDGCKDRSTTLHGVPGGDPCPDEASTWALIPQEYVLAAAADHCLGAAYRGECPGVDPDDLMRWRAESRAHFQKRPVEEVLADVERARVALLEAPVIDGSARGVSVRDMRGERVAELPEAATRDGEAYIAGPLLTPDGRTKYTCSGPLQVIQDFLDGLLVPNLVDTYGDPTRGFAGGYTE